MNGKGNARRPRAGGGGREAGEVVEAGEARRPAPPALLPPPAPRAGRGLQPGRRRGLERRVTGFPAPGAWPALRRAVAGPPVPRSGRAAGPRLPFKSASGVPARGRGHQSRGPAERAAQGGFAAPFIPAARRLRKGLRLPPGESPRRREDELGREGPLGRATSRQPLPASGPSRPAQEALARVSAEGGVWGRGLREHSQPLDGCIEAELSSAGLPRGACPHPPPSLRTAPALALSSLGTALPSACKDHSRGPRLPLSPFSAALNLSPRTDLCSRLRSSFLRWQQRSMKPARAAPGQHPSGTVHQDWCRDRKPTASLIADTQPLKDCLPEGAGAGRPGSADCGPALRALRSGQGTQTCFLEDTSASGVRSCVALAKHLASLCPGFFVYGDMSTSQSCALFEGEVSSRRGSVHTAHSWLFAISAGP
ncbi:uncharacterized protein LOC124964789 [Sciurus carolinensis]|uniref:uncharacterized protein LOC124964789 n=1 Tax=Sciurus carolinensis TaxID=30640 RepID=UPI001FB315EC|nr:uncharacterized protein LOC124964789 [Sciurus carolinensis]